ncbi:guanylyl cyclase [Reticulomyxa filosa]|uniref:adenylate cyclase n=1 Tax=Reticulomyxa filosa TaxID=46433 RepID=X6P0I6_RETFI|nr:guanylyl cyclase [Reticulomyxa filosa]|eukprot:ETO31648.1 guanylyl cyclase [Reticulomyxa filosa]
MLLSTSSWLKQHIRHKRTDNAHLLEMNFYQFLNAEDTHANIFTLRFPTKTRSNFKKTFFSKITAVFVGKKSNKPISSNDIPVHGRFSTLQTNNEEFKLEEMYQTKLITTHLRNYGRSQISLWAFNLMLLMNVITIKKSMPHDSSVSEDFNSNVTPPPNFYIQSNLLIPLLVEAIVAFIFHLLICISHILSHGRQQRKQFYRCMIVVYVFFWLHVLGVTYVTAETNRLFARFIANVFYILSFSVFPFRFFEIGISSFVMVFFVDNGFLSHNSSYFFILQHTYFFMYIYTYICLHTCYMYTYIYKFCVCVLFPICGCVVNVPTFAIDTSVLLEKEWRRNIVYEEAIEKSKKEREQSTSVLLPLFVAQQLLCKSMLEQSKQFLDNNPSFVVSLLHHFYSKYDQFAAQFNVEKIETIGDAYICVSFGGIPEHIIEFALNVVNMHIQFKDSRIPNIFQPGHVSDPINIHIRVGIAHGTC